MKKETQRNQCEKQLNNTNKPNRQPSVTLFSYLFHMEYTLNSLERERQRQRQRQRQRELLKSFIISVGERLDVRKRWKPKAYRLRRLKGSTMHSLFTFIFYYEIIHNIFFSQIKAFVIELKLFFLQKN